jgi:hypothetical protein
MAAIHAQHAQAGEYHLETWFLDGRWEWKAIAMKPRLPEFTGTADSLDLAKEAARLSIGLKIALAWTSVGPAIETPDSGRQEPLQS